MTCDSGPWALWQAKGWHLSLFASGHTMIEADFATPPRGHVKISSPREVVLERWEQLTSCRIGPLRADLEEALTSCEAALGMARVAEGSAAR